MLRLFFAGLAGLLILAACSGGFDTPDLPSVCKQFSEAMRWRDYVGAASFLQEDLREGFLDQFEPDVDLHIVDSQVATVELHEGYAEADYRMEYYRLPSMRVKKWHWQQRWELREGKGLQPGIWLITSPAPAVP